MPEIRIQDLLETINKDGIEKGEEQARKIISEANEKAAAIIRDAEGNSRSMIEAAKAECDTFVKQGNAALRQAADNVCISLKSELNGMIAKVVRKTLESKMRSDGMIELIREALKVNPSRNVVLELSRNMFDFCSNSLHDEISKGLEIKASDAVRSGFRLSERNGSGYYDFSADELVGLVMPYLSDSLTNALKG